MLKLMALSLLAHPVSPSGPPIVAKDEDVTVELSGSLRARGEIYRGNPFGSEGPDDNGYILWRALTSVEVRHRPEVAFHVQFGWHQQSGRNGGPAPTDKGNLDVRKAYVQIAPFNGTQIRLGRQELSFGSSRLVSTRDGPNLRRVFDGAYTRFKQGRWTGHAFIVRPVKDKPDAFDDVGDRDQHFGGVYITRARDENGLDVYFFNLHRKSSRFGSLVAPEKRRTVGARVFGRFAAIDYNFEGASQWGRFGGEGIDAWTLASDTGLTFHKHRHSPRLGLKLNITSGDRNGADGKLQTFNPLFPNLSYFNDAALLAPQNHINLHPSISARLTPELQMGTGVNWFWRTTTADDIYRGPAIPIGATTGSRRVGRQIDVNFLWQPVQNVEIRGSYVRFDVAEALRKLSGSDTDFVMVSIQTKF